MRLARELAAQARETIDARMGQTTPGRVDNIFSALSTVVPSHLMDKDLFNFRDLKLTGEAVANGDIAFDEEPCAPPSNGIIRMHIDRDDEADE